MAKFNVKQDEPLLIVKNISKKFKDVYAVKNASLEVYPKQKIFLFGASGSGKSTFLRCINYLSIPNEGTVWLDGDYIGGTYVNGKWVKDNHTVLAKKRMHIGMVFQHFNLFAHLSALDNVTIGPIKILGKNKSEAEIRAKTLLEKVHMEAHMEKLPAQLSGGQKQRVAIARAMAMDPKLILFDEPTSALDPKLSTEVLEVMSDLAKEDMTMVVVSHELSFAKNIGDVVIYMEDGEMIESGPPKQVFDAPSDPRTESFISHIKDKK